MEQKRRFILVERFANQAMQQQKRQHDLVRNVFFLDFFLYQIQKTSAFGPTTSPLGLIPTLLHAAQALQTTGLLMWTVRLVSKPFIPSHLHKPPAFIWVAWWSTSAHQNHRGQSDQIKERIPPPRKGGPGGGGPFQRHHVNAVGPPPPRQPRAPAPTDLGALPHCAGVKKRRWGCSESLQAMLSDRREGHDSLPAPRTRTFPKTGPTGTWA